MADSSMTITIAVDNTDKVGEELIEACRRALEICGGKGETYAKLKCPVRTGNLRNSITHEVADDGKSVKIGSNVEYAPYVELGTYRMREQPYLRPAIENHIGEYKNIIESELKK